MANTSIKNTIKLHASKINKANILCIGDMILDHYIYGNVERMSPEAPVPILSVVEEKIQLGGVGNVARNISSLGGKAIIISINGNDDSSKKIRKLIGFEKNVKGSFLKDLSYTTPIKMRFLNKSSHLLRVDKEEKPFSKKNKVSNKKVIDVVKKEIKFCDAIILSDYNKGLLTKSLIKQLVKLAKQNEKIIFADPKSKDFSIYEGVNFLTPNQKELSEATGNYVNSEKDVTESAKEIIKKYKIENILVTRSEKGMILVNNKKSKNFFTIAKEIYDVSGAGDTVVAVLALMIAAGLNIETSTLLANHAAGIVVGKRGTAVTTKNEMINF